jgi:hypothetical protein
MRFRCKNKIQKQYCINSGDETIYFTIVQLNLRSFVIEVVVFR